MRGTGVNADRHHILLYRFTAHGLLDDLGDVGRGGVWLLSIYRPDLSLDWVRLSEKLLVLCGYAR